MKPLPRAATPRDLDDVFEIEREVFPDEPYPRFFFRQALDLWGEGLRVAEAESGALVGYALGTLPARSGSAWILSAAVRPPYRGAGIAAELTRDLLDVLDAAGASEVRLTVDPENDAALALYRRLGFVALCEEEGYFGVGSVRVLMVRR